MRTKIAAVAATVLLAAGGAALASVASASAATDPPGGTWDHTWTTTDSKHGGTIQIEEHGDLIDLCDTAADGVSPRVRMYAWSDATGYTYRYTLTASGGNGACAVAQASDGGVYNLPENVNINCDLFLGPYPGEHRTQPTFLNDH
ncbi:MAG: hypothetical protein WCA46_07535 [Actinocatenispora sp.]